MILGDGSVDLLDVAPFVDALILGEFEPCADVNEDNVVNLLDVEPFVTLIAGGGYAISPFRTLNLLDSRKVGMLLPTC